MSCARPLPLSLLAPLAAACCLYVVGCKETTSEASATSASATAPATAAATMAPEEGYKARVAKLTAAELEQRLTSRTYKILSKQDVKGGTKLNVTSQGSSPDRVEIATIALTTEASVEAAKALNEALYDKGQREGASAITGGTNVLYVRIDRSKSAVQTPSSRASDALTLAMSLTQ